LFVVSRGRLVRSPHFAKRRAAGFEDFRHSEAAADLDKFAARDHDFALWGHDEMAQHEHERRGAIVYHRGGFGAAENGEIVFQVARATAALAASEIVFEVVVVRRQCPEGLLDGCPQWRTAEIGMD